MIWWLTFVGSSCLNFFILMNIKPRTKVEIFQKILSSLFITSTTIRSIFPRIDVERICYFDSFIPLCLTKFVLHVLVTRVREYH